MRGIPWVHYLEGECPDKKSKFKTLCGRKYAQRLHSYTLNPFKVNCPSCVTRMAKQGITRHIYRSDVHDFKKLVMFLKYWAKNCNNYPLPRAINYTELGDPMVPERFTGAAPYTAEVRQMFRNYTKDFCKVWHSYYRSNEDLVSNKLIIPTAVCLMLSSYATFAGTVWKKDMFTENAAWTCCYDILRKTGKTYYLTHPSLVYAPDYYVGESDAVLTALRWLSLRKGFLEISFTALLWVYVRGLYGLLEKEFAPALELFKSGYLPLYDGLFWRLYDISSGLRVDKIKERMFKDN